MNNAMTKQLEPMTDRPVEMVSKFLQENGWATVLGVHVLDDFAFNYRFALYKYLEERQEELDEAKRQVAQNPPGAPGESTAIANCGGPGARKQFSMPESDVQSAPGRPWNSPRGTS